MRDERVVRCVVGGKEARAVDEGEGAVGRVRV